MVTNNVEILNSEMVMFSGSAGTGGGTSYVPLKNSVFDFFNSPQFQVSATAVSATVVNGTMGAVNSYVAMPFITAESVAVNRLIMRVGSVATPQMAVQGGIMQFDTTTGYPTQVGSVVQFVSSQTISTSASFVAGNYIEFAFATTTLAANTWYAAGAAVLTYTSGNFVFNTLIIPWTILFTK